MKPLVGRPRDEHSRKAILASAFKVLQERGYAGLALELVAKEAGVGKTTIYRWWAGRAALAVDAFFEETVEELSFPDTGSASEDFRLQLRQLADLLRSERGQVLAALIAGSRTDALLVKAIDEQWVRPRREWGFARISRAVAAGECVPNLHIGSALETLYTPLYARLFLGQAVHTGGEIDRHCAFVFPVIFVSKII